MSLGCFLSQLSQSLLRALLFCKQDHSCDDVRLVASLFVQRSTIAVEYGSLNLAVLAGYIVDISR